MYICVCVCIHTNPSTVWCFAWMPVAHRSVDSECCGTPRIRVVREHSCSRNGLKVNFRWTSPILKMSCSPPYGYRGYSIMRNPPPLGPPQGPGYPPTVGS